MPRKRSEEKEDIIYDYLKSYTKSNGYPPSIREICSQTGLKSTSSVFGYLNRLESRGLIVRDENANRAIKIVDDSFSMPTRDLVDIPLVGQVAAGTPILAEENIEEYFPMPAGMLPSSGSDDLFMLKVKGDSMINVGIYNGDLVICSKSHTANNGEIAVVLVDDSATVKRFYKENGHYRLQPENDYMDPIIVNECSVIGKVIGLFRLGI